ncbi:MAG TPA: DUF2844 domain-containing protein [Polyangia bacterium]
MKPNRRRSRRLFAWPGAVLALAMVLQFSFPARAALGDDVTAVATDQARMQASLQVWSKSHYEIHELDAPTGIKVRQFVGDSGKVFAVSWSGGWRPNLRDIMGDHYDKFIAATCGKRVARGVARIELPGMVVVMGGHQRAFFGHVYLTDLVPAGFLPEEIR